MAIDHPLDSVVALADQQFLIFQGEAAVGPRRKHGLGLLELSAILEEDISEDDPAVLLAEPLSQILCLREVGRDFDLRVVDVNWQKLVGEVVALGDADEEAWEEDGELEGPVFALGRVYPDWCRRLRFT